MRVRNLKKTLVHPHIIISGGSLCTHCRPRRWFFDKWFLSFFNFPHSTYPDYVHGPCYIISRGTLIKLLDSYLYVRHFPFEDIFFTGLMAKFYLNISLTSIEVHIERHKSCVANVYQRKLIASHTHTLHEIQKCWSIVLVNQRKPFA